MLSKDYLIILIFSISNSKCISQLCSSNSFLLLSISFTLTFNKVYSITYPFPFLPLYSIEMELYFNNSPIPLTASKQPNWTSSVLHSLSYIHSSAAYNNSIQLRVDVLVDETDCSVHRVWLHIDYWPHTTVASHVHLFLPIHPLPPPTHLQTKCGKERK